MERRSSEINKLAAKLAAISAKIGDVQHDSKNATQGYTYTSFDAIAAKLRQPMAEVGVMIFLDEIAVTVARTWEAGQYKTTWTCLRVTYDATIVDVESGQFITLRCSGEGADPGDKALPKAQTMAMKYLLKALFRVSTGKDDAEADEQTDKALNEPPPRITPEQEATIIALIEEVKARKEDFCKFFMIKKISDLMEKDYATAIRMLETKRRARIREREVTG